VRGAGRKAGSYRDQTIDLSQLPATSDYAILDRLREQVFINGKPLRQVLHPDQVKGGCFCYDETGRKLLIRPQVIAGEMNEEQVGEAGVDLLSFWHRGKSTLDLVNGRNDGILAD